jgi:hypothetical protein
VRFASARGGNISDCGLLACDSLLHEVVLELALGHGSSDGCLLCRLYDELLRADSISQIASKQSKAAESLLSGRG